MKLLIYLQSISVHLIDLTNKQMDFAAVKLKLHSQSYRTFIAFQNDMNLVFDNCIKLNLHSLSLVAKCYELQNKYFEKIVDYEDENALKMERATSSCDNSMNKSDDDDC